MTVRVAFAVAHSIVAASARECCVREGSNSNDGKVRSVVKQYPLAAHDGVLEVAEATWRSRAATVRGVPAISGQAGPPHGRWRSDCAPAGLRPALRLRQPSGRSRSPARRPPTEIASRITPPTECGIISSGWLPNRPASRIEKLSTKTVSTLSARTLRLSRNFSAQ